MTAACAGVAEPLWDDRLPGESDGRREARHHRALAYCRRCPVVDWCGRTVDPARDEGVRAGRVLPPVGPSPHGRVPAEVRHGTVAGEKAHRRRGETACGACRDAVRVARREWRARAARKRVAS